MKSIQDKKLEELLKLSKATPLFKQAVQEFLEGKETDLIIHVRNSPGIKIIRVLMKLLEEYPDVEITDVNIQGVSSCSAFSGTLTFGPVDFKIQFNWDCSWRAEQEGYQTWFGHPDQVKAAQVFGYQCFEKFEQIM